MDLHVLDRTFQERTRHRGIARTFECAHGTIQHFAQKILAWHLGDGSEKSCQDLWEKLLSRCKTITRYSDSWKSYNILNDKTHTLVGKETGQTNHVERWNGTLRQRHVSFVPKSLSFAKKLEFFEKRCLFFCYNYNGELTTA
jgi:insertion element IS1 protein InsB